MLEVRKCTARRSNEAGKAVEGGVEGGFRDVDAPYLGVAGVLEFMEKRLDPVTPKAGV